MTKAVSFPILYVKRNFNAIEKQKPENMHMVSFISIYSSVLLTF